MGQSVAENRYGAVSELGPRDNKSITGPGIYQLKGDLQAYINTKRSANNTPSQATQAIHRVHSMEPVEFLHFGEEYGERQLSFQTPGRSHKLYQACRLTYCGKINPFSGNPKKYIHLCLCFWAMNKMFGIDLQQLMTSKLLAMRANVSWERGGEGTNVGHDHNLVEPAGERGDICTLLRF